MSAPKSSRAYGKAWGDTTVPVSQTEGEIDRVLKRYDPFVAIQWTSFPGSLQLRFRMNGRNYVFNMAQYEDDPHESRRGVRAVLWFLKGLFGLGVEKDDELFPERALLPYTEIAPNLTLASALEAQNGKALAAIGAALGRSQLALESGDER